MKETNKVQFSFTVNRGEKQSLEAAAKEMGITFTELLRTGAAFYASFDSAFWKKVKNFSRNLGIQEYLILQNLTISWMARKEARAEVWGPEPEQLLREFQFQENGPVTGEDLHETLKKSFVREFENEKEYQLNLDSQYGALSEEDAEWLKQRYAKYNKAKEAQKEAIESRKRGLTASFHEGENEGKILADMKAKREK